MCPSFLQKDVAKVLSFAVVWRLDTLKENRFTHDSLGIDVEPNDFQEPTVNLRMEEHAFDPVRAVASLSPSSLLCPTGALRVLGSGFIGIVFLEEDETG